MSLHNRSSTPSAERGVGWTLLYSPIAHESEVPMATTGTGPPRGPRRCSSGQAIRAARERAGCRCASWPAGSNVSPSFVSQVELGKANPSVGTLYALVVGARDHAGRPDRRRGRRRFAVPSRRRAARRRATPGHLAARRRTGAAGGGRKRVEMSGVVWERLTHDHDPYVDFLHVEYAPGSSSCAPEQLMRHGGREYGHLLTAGWRSRSASRPTRSAPATRSTSTR